MVGSSDTPLEFGRFSIKTYYQNGRRQTPEELNMSETVPVLAMTGLCGGRIVGRVQKFAKFPNLNGFREFESHPPRHK